MVHLLFPKQTIYHRYDLSKRLSRPALLIASTNQRPVFSLLKLRVLKKKKHFRPREKMATKAMQSAALRKKTFR